MMLSRAAIAGPLLLVLLAAPAVRGQSEANLPEEVWQLLTLTNEDRADQGLGSLQWSPELARAAELHDEQMVRRNDLEHQFSGEPDLASRAGRAGAHFHAVAENIALGANAVALEREWMHSPKHRENILDARMNTIGIALVRRNGELWAVEDFAQAVEELGPQSAEHRVLGLLAHAGLTNAKATSDARQTCEMQHGSAGSTRPLFIMRWESSDLSRLPDVLLSKLESRRFHSAAVGVCDSAQPRQGFTTHRVAVLLY